MKKSKKIAFKKLKKDQQGRGLNGRKHKGRSSASRGNHKHKHSIE